MSHISLIKFNKGFTLVELIVSIGIMTVILTTVVTSQTSYTSGSSLRQIADDISLSLRQAQVYGISVSQLSGNFDTGYGIEFRMASVGGNDDAYVLFADGGPIYNYMFDGSWTSCDGECLQKTVLTRGNLIQELCAIYLDINTSESCAVTSAHVAFLRPATDAHIKLFIDSSEIDSSTIKGVRIRLVSPGGELKSIVVYTTGQISVQDD